jgi:predicted N-acetyltransferase YhbS
MIPFLDLSIRNMERRDAPKIVQMLASQGWVVDERILQPYFNLDLSTSFVAEVEGRVVGCVNSLIYGEVAWLGNLVVAEPLRRRGIGTALTMAAVKACESKGVRSIVLNSVPEAVTLYERTGFRGFVQLERFAGFVERRVGDAERCEVEDLTGLDAKLHGYDRSKVLHSLLDGANVVRCRCGDNVGFAAAKMVGSKILVGPILTTQPEERLYLRLLSNVVQPFPKDVHAKLEVPLINPPAMNACATSGLKGTRLNLIMVRGKEIKSDYTRIGAIASDGDLG